LGDLHVVENLFRDETKKVKKRKKTAKATLSFDVDDEGDMEEGTSSAPTPKDDESDAQPTKRPKFRKNPNVDTSFLPDREREEAERRERERLRKEWLHKQEEIKKEEIEVTYSYWDGSGNRKSVLVRSPLVIAGYNRHKRHMHRSAKKVMISAHSWRNSGSNSPSSEASA
jgi:protein FAM50